MISPALYATKTQDRPVASLLIRRWIIFLGFWTFFRVWKLSSQWLSTGNLNF